MYVIYIDWRLALLLVGHQVKAVKWHNILLMETISWEILFGITGQF